MRKTSDSFRTGIRKINKLKNISFGSQKNKGKPKIRQVFIGSRKFLTHEGLIYRYKGGIENNFIPRWMTTYEHCLAMYKSLDYSLAGMHKPLLALPKEVIKNIRPVRLTKKNKFISKKKSQKA